MPWYLKYSFDYHNQQVDQQDRLEGVEDSLSARDAAIEAAREKYSKKLHRKLSDPTLVWHEPLPKKEE